MTIQNLLPTIVGMIKVAVEKSCEKKIAELQEEIDHVRESVSRDRVLSRIKEDKLEQCLRRENMKVY